MIILSCGARPWFDSQSERATVRSDGVAAPDSDHCICIMMIVEIFLIFLRKSLCSLRQEMSGFRNLYTVMFAIYCKFPTRALSSVFCARYYNAARKAAQFKHVRRAYKF